MKSKFYYIFGAGLIVVLGIYFLSNYSKTETTTTVKDQQSGLTQETTDTDTSNEASTEANQAPVDENKPSADAHYSSEVDVQGDDNHDILVTQVDYDGTHFTPSLINIKVGDIVFFKNNSGKPFRPASGPHPSHTAYPEFDAKENIAAGDTFQFKFTKVGNWTYHDHLNESASGTINVTK